MYNHDSMNPEKGPLELQRKVQFDIRFYFCRRGCENMEKMLKTDFAIKYNGENEEWFVIKVCDELTKNHRTLESVSSGIMPENKTDPLCPVASFRKYQNHLNPDNKYMWQYPLENIDPQKPNIWFSRKNVGKNPLSSFMSEVSKNLQSVKNLYKSFHPCYRLHSVELLELFQFRDNVCQWA